MVVFSAAIRYFGYCLLVLVAAYMVFVHLTQQSSRQPAALCCHAACFALRCPQRGCLCPRFAHPVATEFGLGLRPAGRLRRTSNKLSHVTCFASLQVSRLRPNAQSGAAVLASLVHLCAAPRWHSQRPHAQ